MKKKKVDKILKGVLTVGTVIGGANVMSDADMVYAMEEELSFEYTTVGEQELTPTADIAETPESFEASTSVPETLPFNDTRVEESVSENPTTPVVVETPR